MKKITLEQIKIMPPLKKDQDGNVLKRTIKVNMADLKIILLDREGNVVIPGEPGNPKVMSYDWDVEIHGIDNKRVERIKLPELTPDDNEELTAEVTLIVCEGDLESTEEVKEKEE